MSESIDFEDESKKAISKSASKKLKKKVNAKNAVKRITEHGFMYIGHMPHGFYEEEVRSYFSQFGKILKIRLARSKKTGNHKGYGFIEFKDKAVAQIAAETMNNYLMFNKILKCHLIPKKKLHPLTFKNSRKKFIIRLHSLIRKNFNRKRSPEQLKKMKERQKERMLKREAKLKELGINLDLSKLVKSQNESTKDQVKSQEKQVAATPAVNVTAKDEKLDKNKKNADKKKSTEIKTLEKSLLNNSSTAAPAPTPAPVSSSTPAPAAIVSTKNEKLVKNKNADKKKLSEVKNVEKDIKLKIIEQKKNKPVSNELKQTNPAKKLKSKK